MKEMIFANIGQIILGVGLLVTVAIFGGLFLGFKFRKQSLEQAAEEILGTQKFAAAAKVEADKAIRSVEFRESVREGIENDARTASSIIRIVVESPEFRDAADRRVAHGISNNSYSIEKQIRASQDEIRRELKESNKELSEKLDRLMEIVGQIQISCAHHHPMS